MEKKIKYLIIFVFIMILILIGILICIKFLTNEKSISNINNLNEEEKYSSDQDIDFRNNVEKTTSKYEYFDTVACIQKYIDLLNKINISNYDGNRNEIGETVNLYKEDLYNMLDNKYKKQYNLTLNNIDNRFSKYYKDLYFDVKNMYVVDIEEENSIYIVYGNLVEKEKKTISTFGFIVIRNTQNLTFSILPYDYMEDKGYKEEKLNSVDMSELKNIEVNQNESNSYISDAYDEEYISNYYFNQYKNNLQYNIKENYDNLDSEYKKTRFPTLKSYQDYIENNFSDLIKCNLKQYSVEKNNENTRYICKDQFNNYYIFNETEIGKYTILLDTYTSLDEEYASKYSKATNQEKVSMNIAKFFQMLNTKDYSSAYKLLSTDYKNNVFKTQSDFEKYIKEKLYSYNSVIFLTFSDKISGVYTYSIEISNAENESDKRVKMNIIMVLKENMQYELSFQVID